MTDAQPATAPTDESSDEPDEDKAYLEHVRLTGALRRVLEANAHLGAPIPGSLTALIDDAEALAGRLEAMAGPEAMAARRRVRSRTTRDVMFADPGRAMANNPIVGRCNPIAPAVDMSLLDGEVRGRARLGQAYEGPPGRVHGGWVCGLLDQVLGFACVAAGHPGFTATLTVQLREATPLDSELELVGLVTEVAGRRIKAWGAIHAGGVLTAEAEGLFIAIPPDFGSDPHDYASPDSTN